MLGKEMENVGLGEGGLLARRGVCHRERLLGLLS